MSAQVAPPALMTKPAWLLRYLGAADPGPLQAALLNQAPGEVAGGALEGAPGAGTIQRLLLPAAADQLLHLPPDGLRLPRLQVKDRIEDHGLRPVRQQTPPVAEGHPLIGEALHALPGEPHRGLPEHLADLPRHRPRHSCTRRPPPCRGCRGQRPDPPAPAAGRTPRSWPGRAPVSATTCVSAVPVPTFCSPPVWITSMSRPSSDTSRLEPLPSTSRGMALPLRQPPAGTSAPQRNGGRPAAGQAPPTRKVVYSAMGAFSRTGRSGKRRAASRSKLVKPGHTVLSYSTCPAAEPQQGRADDAGVVAQLGLHDLGAAPGLPAEALVQHQGLQGQPAGPRPAHG